MIKEKPGKKCRAFLLSSEEELLGKIQSLRTDNGDYLKLEDYLELEESVRWFEPEDIDMEEFDRLRY